MQAMILAAGLGTRLLPYTQYRPKPLFPVINKPLLVCTVGMLQRFGAEKIVVNCHHLRDQIVEKMAGHEHVVIQEEETILGTGGGVRRAVKHLADEPLVLTNGDIYHEIDIQALYKQHQGSGAEVTLAMHEYPRFNTVDVEGGEVRGFSTGEKKAAKMAFTGIHVINPNVLDRIIDKEYSCIIDLYRELIKENIPIKVFDTSNKYWTDMGTVEDYIALNNDILSQQVYRLPELGEINDRIYKGTNVTIASDVQLDGCCVIGNNAIIESGARLSNVIVWDGGVVKAGTVYNNAVVAR